jgi:hypothetical protein
MADRDEGTSSGSTGDAISRWNELLAGEPDLDASVDRWRADFARLGLQMDGRPLCTVLRPHLIGGERLARQAAVARLVMSALRKVRAALDDDRELYRVHLDGLHEWVGHLLSLEPRVAGEGALVRLDASLARTRLHFIEVNADTPGGAGHNDAILDFFERMPTYARLEREYALRPLRLRERQLAALLDSWGEWGGEGRPTIGIFTRRGDPAMRAGLELDRELYASRGFEAVIADPEQLSFEGGRLRMGDVAVDLVHRACPTRGFLGGVDELAPLFDAIRAEAVCLVNPFRSELLGHKAIFTLLTDPRYEFGFDAAERAAIRAHVPWARPVRDGRTTDPDGEEIDLVDYLRRQRRRLVLKPAHDFGGHGVTLGWREDDSSWEREIETALAADFVVQQRVELQREEYPAMAPGAPLCRLYEDTDPFMFRGEFGGMLTRLGTSEITNVHADGSVCATVAVSSRSG